MSQAHSKSRGFTLLEVIVALAITGFVLGGLFTLVGTRPEDSGTQYTSTVRLINALDGDAIAALADEGYTPLSYELGRLPDGDLVLVLIGQKPL